MTKQETITIVTPCYNEENVILTFLSDVIEVLQKHPEYRFNIIVVDDSSFDDTPSLLQNFQVAIPNIALHVIRNKINAGHQRSIFHGLVFSEGLEQDYLIIMDSDGEDNPDAISELLTKKNYDIVEVRRGRRNESLMFKTMYFFYKLLFRIITKKTMNYGNFCMLNKSVVEKITLSPFVHLPAFLLKLNVKKTSITYDRSPRINGNSKMGYKGLLLHAFNSLVEFGNDMLFWLLRIFVVVAIALVIVSANLFYQKFIAHTAILGWFSVLFVGLLNLAMLCLGFFVIGILVMNRASQTLNFRSTMYHVIKSGSTHENSSKMA